MLSPPPPAAVPTASAAIAAHAGISPFIFPTSGTTPAAAPDTSIQKQPVRFELINLFFQFFHPFFPVVNKTRFFANIHKVHPLLLNAMYAVATPYFNHIFSPNYDDSQQTLYSAGDSYYTLARQMLDQYMDDPDIYGVSAVLILSVHSCLTGRGSAAWQLTGSAVRMAQQLDLHIDPTILDEFPEIEEMEERRSLWWVCYEIDRYCSSFAGLPFIIQDDDYSVKIPEYPSLNNPNSCPDLVFMSLPADQHAATAHSYFVQLLQIYSGIVKFTRNWVESNASAKAQVRPNEEMQTALEEKLAAWFASLPRWMHTYSQPTECGRTPHSAKFFRFYIHIFYHYCVLSVRLPPIVHYLQVHRKTCAVSSELPIAIAAAKSITSILKEIAYHNPFYQFMAPFLASCLSLSGMLHALTRQHHHLDIHVTALQAIGKFVLRGSQDAAVLTTLKFSSIDTCLRVLRNKLKSSWSLKKSYDAHKNSTGHSASSSSFFKAPEPTGGCSISETTQSGSGNDYPVVSPGSISENAMITGNLVTDSVASSINMASLNGTPIDFASLREMIASYDNGLGFPGLPFSFDPQQPLPQPQSTPMTQTQYQPLKMPLHLASNNAVHLAGITPVLSKSIFSASSSSRVLDSVLGQGGDMSIDPPSEALDHTKQTPVGSMLTTSDTTRGQFSDTISSSLDLNNLEFEQIMTISNA
eukprot:jgi/Hompol1/5157/HPOL_004177-RA